MTRHEGTKAIRGWIKSNRTRLSVGNHRIDARLELIRSP